MRPGVFMVSQLTEDQKRDLRDYMDAEFPDLFDEKMKARLVEIQEYLLRKLAEKRGEQ